jgi:hypothetical protein
VALPLSTNSDLGSLSTIRLRVLSPNLAEALRRSLVLEVSLSDVRSESLLSLHVLETALPPLVSEQMFGETRLSIKDSISHEARKIEGR